MNGCYFSNHYATDDPNPVVQKFVNDYKAKYGQMPDALAALAYDAARILADVDREGRLDRRRRRSATDRGDQGLRRRDRHRSPSTPSATRSSPAVILKVENGKYLLTETIKPDQVQQ